MIRIKILIEYNGEDYVGWQIQRDGKSIQSEIEKSLEEIYDTKIKLIVAGRTDAGVHALEQVAHFDLDDNKIPEDKIFKALNSNLRERANKITILEVMILLQRQPNTVFYFVQQNIEKVLIFQI